MKIEKKHITDLLNPEMGLSTKTNDSGLTRKLSLAAYLAIFASSTYASTHVGQVSSESVLDSLNKTDSTEQLTEKNLSGWALSLDNDLLVPSSRDQDYTYGVSLTISGNATKDYALSLDTPLSWLNRKIGIIGSSQTPSHHSVEAGLYGFTPEDISRSDAASGDRPYASLIYWSSTQEFAGSTPNISWRSSLTLGVMGLDLVGNVQNEVHKLTGSNEAKGWDQQISDGGEITGRYSISHHHNWNIKNPRVEFKTSTQASVGYLTEASYGMSLRYGKIQSRWQSYNPELTTYAENTNQSINPKYVDESYALMGVAVKARAYNAFLQGQFRNSAIEYDYNDLNHGLIEAWLGYAHSFRGGYKVSYLLRAHSSEVKDGIGDRTLVWGGLTLSKSY